MKSGNAEDVMQSASIVMEGFIYRTHNDTSSQFPVYQQGKPDSNFPILPVGMRELWAKDEDLMGMF